MPSRSEVTGSPFALEHVKRHPQLTGAILGSIDDYSQEMLQGGERASKYGHGESLERFVVSSSECTLAER